MSKLFVANTTNQHHHFLYRLAGMSQAYPRWIMAGQQIVIEGSPDEVAQIIQQHEKYGMRDAAAVSRRRDFTGLCYSVDDPTDVDRLLHTFEQNDDVREVGAQRRREVAAAAMSNGIAKELGKRTGIDPEKLRPERLEVETRDAEDGSTVSGVEVVSDPDKVKPRRSK